MRSFGFGLCRLLGPCNYPFWAYIIIPPVALDALPSGLGRLPGPGREVQATQDETRDPANHADDEVKAQGSAFSLPGPPKEPKIMAPISPK